jgi:hypothetical protein
MDYTLKFDTLVIDENRENLRIIGLVAENWTTPPAYKPQALPFEFSCTMWVESVQILMAWWPLYEGLHSFLYASSVVNLLKQYLL